MANSSQVRTYDPAKSTVFLKTNERFGGLSNMAAKFPLHVNGASIRTAEALYQACRFPLLPKVQEAIIAQRSPMTAKMLSRRYWQDSRNDWNTVRVKVMRWCLRVKLAQNPSTFGELLISTDDRPIVEQSRKDSFWGAKAIEDGTLVGANVLGRLLMELREQLKTKGVEGFRVVMPLPIPDFLLFQQPIEEVRDDGEAESPAKLGSQQALSGILPATTDIFEEPLLRQPVVRREHASERATQAEAE